MTDTPKKTLLSLVRPTSVVAGALLCGLTFGLGSTQTAHATDSGLGFYPTADIYPSGNYHFDFDTFGSGLKTDGTNSFGLEYGFGKGGDGLFGRNEVGFDYAISGYSNDNAYKRASLNFKTQLYNNDAKTERIAIGFSGLGDRSSFSSANLRLLGYKGFSFGRVHAGVYKDIKRSRGGSDTGGLQLGFDRSIGKHLIVGGDYRSGPSGYLAPCVIYNFNDKADFELCVGRANNTSVSPRYLTYFGFDYNFDFKKNKDVAPVNPPNLNTTPGDANPGPQ